MFSWHFQLYAAQKFSFAADIEERTSFGVEFDIGSTVIAVGTESESNHTAFRIGYDFVYERVRLICDDTAIFRHQFSEPVKGSHNMIDILEIIQG